MENIVQAIVCPNCGANATNHQNCEYCGSLLVRFADKNIAIDESRYGYSAFRFSGLEDALIKNLEEQARTDGNNHIHTFIRSRSLNLELDVTNPKSQTETTYYQWGDKNTFRVSPDYPTTSDEQSLVICIRFYEITNKLKLNSYTSWDSGDMVELNNYNSEAHARFQGLDIYDLFSLQTNTLLDNESGMAVGNVYQYYLDFGRDVQGAASIITQYLLGNYVIPNVQTMRLSYELSSINDEDYLVQVREDTKRANKYFWLLLILGIIFIPLGILMAIDGADEGDPEYLVTGVAMIIGGPLLIYLAFQKVHKKSKELEETDRQ